MAIQKRILLRLLVVDDAQEEASLYGWYLAKLKQYEVLIDYAENGLKGIEKLDKGQYDLVFTDYRMPVMDGLTFLGEVKKRGFQVPIVVLTGAGDETVAAKAMKLGALDYLPKRNIPRTDFGAILARAIETKRARDDLKERQELDGLRDQLVADLSGELRNSLEALKKLRDDMASGRPERAGAMQADLRALQEAVIHMEGLIEDLNNLRAVAHPDAYKLRPVSLKEMLGAGLGRKRPVLEAMQIEVEQKIPPRDMRVKADPDCVQVVLENLISNAVHFTPNGGRLSIAAERFSSGLVRVGIHNEGRAPSIGAFVRLMAGSKLTPQIPASPTAGLGLGLRICRKIIESHGGRLWLESDGQGTTTFITLPTASKK